MPYRVKTEKCEGMGNQFKVKEKKKKKKKKKQAEKDHCLRARQGG